MIFQNEAPYLKEWIDFHRKVGVEHFWLYNHLSTDNYKDVLQPYITEGIVELVEWEILDRDVHEWNTIQCASYQDAVHRSKSQTTWLVVIDSDEFIFPVIKNSLQEFLEDYQIYSSIGVNWQMFGTSHVPYIAPGESILKQLVWKGDIDFHAHRHVKCIVKPIDVVRYENPHAPVLRRRTAQVNADKMHFFGPETPYCAIDKIRVNHYWTRDEYFFWNCKIPRRAKWPGGLVHIMAEAEQLNKVHDTVIYKYMN